MTQDMTQPPGPHPIPEKVRLRREALARRATEHRQIAVEGAEQVREQGIRLIAGLAGETVSGYLPIRDEVSPIPLMQALLAAGRRLALPTIQTKWSPLTFRAWRPGDRLCDADFGLKEPAVDANEVLPDILLLPLAAFDAEGYRIGYGGGYYDRTLTLYRSQRSVAAIGIAFDCQEVPAFVHEPHDERLDYLVTPSGARSFGT